MGVDFGVRFYNSLLSPAPFSSTGNLVSSKNILLRLSSGKLNARKIHSRIFALVYNEVICLQNQPTQFSLRTGEL